VLLADRCTVLRDGRVVATSRRGAFNVADLVHAMTGRTAADVVSETNTPGAVRLEDIGERPDAVRVHANEVVGLAGLLGSGTDRVLRRLFGAGGRGGRGTVNIDGKPRRIARPTNAIRAGIGMVPGERRLGLIPNQSVRDNILLPSLDRLTRAGMVDRAAGDALVARLMDLLDIRPRRPELRAGALSGGNQQKVIMAKWLAREVGVLLLDEPTQGVDVAAKAQIHALIRDFARNGGGVLIGSSDLSEIARLCDSVLAMRAGRVTERIARAGRFDEKRLHAAIGG
jgi:ribose transport system ATP-binding protein